jgi:hypothetical protein
VYFPSLILMALDEDRVRDLDRRALNAGMRSLQPGRDPGRVRGRRTRSWGTRARTALRARPAASACRADPRAAGART